MCGWVHVKWRSLSPQPQPLTSPFSLPPVSRLPLIVDGILWPFEVVDAVQASVLMSSGEGPLIT